MAERMDGEGRFSQVALMARARALTATPPEPGMGDSALDPPLPEWIFAVAPMGADVLYTNTSVLPLTAAPWTEVERPSQIRRTEDKDGRVTYESRSSPEAYHPARLPWQAPRSKQRLREERVAEAWEKSHALCLTLKELGIGPRGVGRRSLGLAETALWLSGVLTREPGVPIFAELPLVSRAHFESRQGNQLQGIRLGRNGANITRIECAAAHDLVAAPFAQLSRAQGWIDHEDHAGRPGGSSSAKRAVREGRHLLHGLGAWPWAHAEKGRLHDHPRWWTDPRFLSPLRTWIAQGWARLLYNELARQRAGMQLESGLGPEGAVGEASFKRLQEFASEMVITLDAERFVTFMKRDNPRTP
jgi:hypothetical protein